MLTVAVRIEDIEKRRRSAGLLHIVIGFFLIIKGADLYKQSEYENFWYAVPVLITASLSLFYGFFRKKLDASNLFNSRLRLIQTIIFFILAIIFLSLDRSMDLIACSVFGGLCILLFFSERKIFSETYINFIDTGIQIPGAFSEHLVPWHALTQVVIREDFITIFHKKEKFLQYQVTQDLSIPEIAKLNAFCSEQIEKLTVQEKKELS